MAAEPENMLTPAGQRKLQDEFDHYWKVVRPETVARVAAAAAEGDRSENAEYIYGRRKLRDIDRRLEYLGRLLKNVKIVDPAHGRGDRVTFAATVLVVAADGTQRRWQLVGEGEADGEAGRLSYKSPIGRALMGRKVGDTVTVELPGDEEVEYTIRDLWFGDRHWRVDP